MQATECMAHDALNLRKRATQLEGRRISAQEYAQRNSRANGTPLQKGIIALTNRLHDCMRFARKAKASARAGYIFSDSA